MSGSRTGIDVDSIAAWAAHQLPGTRAPFIAEVIAGGQSNITARLSDAKGRQLVVRRPPLHSVLPTAHDMGREYRIIAALYPTPVPVPQALAYCDDPSVTGAPFYIMSYVDGIVLHDTDTANALEERARAHSGDSLIDALVALHGIDIDEVGLGDLARRDEFVARQLKRWHAQYCASKTQEIPAIDRVHALLAARIPRQGENTVVHGDFRLGNCILGEDGGVSAVLDWEICTLGDPRADVGYVLATWGEPDDRLQVIEDNPTLASGFTTREDLLARYAKESGRDIDDIWFFVAFSFWRLACIFEGVVARLLSGARGDTSADVDAFRRRVDNCVVLAEEIASGL